MGEIFFLYTYIITKNPTRGRVNVTLIEVALGFLVEKDDSSLVEYKVFFLCHIYEVSVNDKQLPYHLFYIFFCEYLLEKHQLLRKVKEFQVKGIILIIFS